VVLPYLLSLFFALHPQDGPHAEVDLTVEDRQIALVVTANLAWLDELMDIPRELPDNLHPSETVTAVEALQDFLFAKATVVIDGAPASLWTSTSPIANHPDPALLPLFPNAGMRGLRKWRFEFRTQLSQPAQQVTLRWYDFAPDRITDPLDPPPLPVTGEIRAQGLVDPFMLTPAEPAYTWSRVSGGLGDRLATYPIPTAVTKPISIALRYGLGASMLATLLLWRCSTRRLPVAAGLSVSLGLALILFQTPQREIPTEQLSAAAKALHLNMYRAFDYTDRDTVYDSLALSVEGELLDTVYEEIFASLVMRDEGGAVARVTSITHHGVTPNTPTLLTREGTPRWSSMVRVQWTVRGRVTHWGHSHQRADRWSALFLLQETSDGWRFTEGVFEERIPEDLEIPDVL